MYWLYYVIGPIAGGLIAASALIIAKAPNADRLINQLLPYKAFIGVGMLALGVLNAIDLLPNIGAIFSASSLFGVTVIAVLASEILIGLLMGLPQIAKWAAGSGVGSRGAERAALVSERLVPFEVPIGLVSIVAGTLAALHLLRVF